MRGTPAIDFKTRQQSPKGNVRVLNPIEEWQTETFEGVALSPADRALAARLGQQGRFQIDELRQGLRIRARSWVGVVRLETVEIRIVPKLAGGQLGLVRLIDLTLGVKGLQALQAERTIDASGNNLLDLLVILLADAVEGVVRRGLLADYLEREGDLRVVRGRILGDRQLLERFGQVDRIVCRFDELRHDLHENRLLLAALRVASRRVSRPQIRRKIERLRTTFESACNFAKLDYQMLLGELLYNRLNEHYRRSHVLARLVLGGFGVDDVLASGSNRSFAFLIDMNALFEQFVEKLVTSAVDSHIHRVQAQLRVSSVVWDSLAGRSYSTIAPDLIVNRRDGLRQGLPIDAKYKLYDRRAVGRNDINQLFFYAYALRREEGMIPTAMLLYPASAGRCEKLQLEVRAVGGGERAQIYGLGVPIPESLSEIESQQMGPVLGTVRAMIDHAFAGGRNGTSPP